MAQAQPLRVKVVEVRPGDTVDKLARRMAVADRHAERFRVLNGMGDKDRLRPGDYIKVVVEYSLALRRTRKQTGYPAFFAARLRRKRLISLLRGVPACARA